MIIDVCFVTKPVVSCSPIHFVFLRGKGSSVEFSGEKAELVLPDTFYGYKGELHFVVGLKEDGGMVEVVDAFKNLHDALFFAKEYVGSSARYSVASTSVELPIEGWWNYLVVKFGGFLDFFSFSTFREKLLNRT